MPPVIRQDSRGCSILQGEDYLMSLSLTAWKVIWAWELS
jgi:hypothetical protein